MDDKSLYIDGNDSCVIRNIPTPALLCVHPVRTAINCTKSTEHPVQTAL